MAKSLMKIKSVIVCGGEFKVTIEYSITYSTEVIGERSEIFLILIKKVIEKTADLKDITIESINS